MNDLQIQYFLSVAEAGGFTAAAQKLFVSQPAVSKQVAALEKELGLQLLERGTKGAALTEAGRLFYAHFFEMAQAFKNTLAKAQGLTPGARMHLNFGTVEDWDVSGFMPRMVSDLKRSHPGLELRVFSKDSVQILKSLKKGELDLILYSPMFLSPADQAELEERFVKQARTIVLFSAFHPLAGKKDLTFPDFRDEPFLLCNRDSNAVLERVVRLCELWGFAPQLEHCVKREDLFLKLQTGYGYTLFHEFVRSKSNPAFRWLPLEPMADETLRQELCLYYRPDNLNPALPIVMEEISKILFEK